MKITPHLFRMGVLVAALVMLLAVPRAALAHAVLVSSNPAQHGAVSGKNLIIQLKFNSRIDAAHSRLYVVSADGKMMMLKTSAQEAPDRLAAEKITLSAGSYTIRWQALASDGHITRGEIPFTVQ